ncbi:O-antigen/teichoic acid export membrane protein [Actinomycetospora succinea]|uniref:O-antigen/teichoic acid export membrane protein n=1 Tax=Actinomycetospora succinea TaxID=663603 RepID=A0A4R6USQ8_9PSEU|nr:hypothetical protein [Actinomycetospora succinea]TDQ48849.1 O-antigen/teichoic acid export membrane protein [Actinomycetospora succinea]
MTIGRRGSRRATIGIADAGLSSLGNLSLSWIGARTLDLPQFGVLSTAMFIGLIAAGLSKAALIDGYTLQHSTSDMRRHSPATRQALGAVLVLAVAGSVLLALAGMASSVFLDLPRGLAALGLLLIPILVQDALRWLCYANADESLALISTAIWTGGVWAGCAFLVAFDAVSLLSLIVVWAFFAGLGALTAMWRSHAWPHVRGATAWWKDARAIGSKSSIDFALTQSVSMGGGLVVAAVAGPAAFGLVRLAQLPLAPVQVLVMGSIALVQPAMVVRVRDGQQRSAYALGIKVCAILALATLVLTALVLAVPVEFMSGVIGDSWPAAWALVPISGAAMLGSLIGASFGPYLRAAGMLGFEVRWKLIASPISLAAVLLGAAVWGAPGGAAGLAFGAAFFSIPLAVRARQSLARESSRLAS